MIFCKRLTSVILFYLILFQISSISLKAQGPNEEVDPIVIQPSGRLNLSLEQLGYETEELSGRNTQQGYRIDLPGNFLISPTDNYFDLIMNQLPVFLEKPVDFRVDLNGGPIFTLALQDRRLISDTIRIDLPEGQPQRGRNNLSFTLNTGSACGEADTPVTVVLDKNSTLSFNYEQAPYSTDLGLYPFPYVEQSLLDIPVTIVLPDQPTSNDLSAATTIAAGLGQASDGAMNLTAVFASELEPTVQANTHLILIGKPDDHSLLADLELPLPITEDILEPGYGIIEEIVSPWNEFRLLLVVSGLDDEGIGKASIALNRQAHFLGMKGPVAVVVDIGDLPSTITLPDANLTLGSLGYEDTVAYGTLPQNFRFDFSLPLGWQVQEPPFFLLKFAHADIIDPEISILDVRLNNTPLGSALLNAENSRAGELLVTLPGHQLRTGRNNLSVGISMSIPNLSECGGAQDQRAWTVISSQSEIFLPYSTIDLQPDLNFFPHPFSQNIGLEQTYFVLPDGPDSAMANYALQLAFQLGRASRTEKLSAPVVYTSEIDNIIRESSHLIVLGHPTANSLLAEVNDQLPHPFVPGTDTLQPLVIDHVVFLADPERKAGLLQIAPSRWNEDRVILAVTGTDEEGVRLAVKALLSASQSLRGNLAVVEPDLNPFSTDPDPIRIYSIDTRTAEPANQQAQTMTATSELSDSQQFNLSEQWWR